MNWVAAFVVIYLGMGQTSGQFSQPLEILFEYLPYLPQFTYAQAGRPEGVGSNASNSASGGSGESNGGQGQGGFGANNTYSSIGYW